MPFRMLLTAACLIFVTSACGDPKGTAMELAARAGQAAGIAPKATPIPQPTPIVFHGLDLTTAPRTSRSADLPDLWEEVPPGSSSFEMRKDIEIAYRGFDGVVYSLPGKSKFYIQHDHFASSTHHYYGPFFGDPSQLMDLSTTPTLESLLSTMPGPAQK